MLEEKNTKILYLQGRPKAHPVHLKLAEQVTTNIDFVDKPIRWQDKKYTGFINSFIWIFNGIHLSLFNNHSQILVDNLHISPIIAKKLKIYGKKTKVYVHLGSHTLFFIKENKFGRINTLIHKWALKNYDAIICEGEMASDFVINILGPLHPNIKISFLGPLQERLNQLESIQPSLDSKNILLIASGPSDFRLYYKGLDFMLEMFLVLIKRIPDIRFTIVGEWNKESLAMKINGIDEYFNKSLFFVGQVESVNEFISNTALYLHMSRGDAFPTSTVEVLTAGVPCIVSDITGTKQIIKEIDQSFIVPLNQKMVIDRIESYFQMSLLEKQELSLKCRKVASNYTLENAIIRYKEIFKELSYEQ